MMWQNIFDRIHDCVDLSFYTKTSFFFLVLIMGLIHWNIEKSIRGNIPADSDSLAYQISALQELTLLQKGMYTIKDFLLGIRDFNHVPPGYKFSLQLGYIL